MYSNNQKGAIAEAVIAAEAIKLGIAVLEPVAEHTRYDLAFDLGGRLLRVQCKWANCKGDVVYVHLAGYRLSGRGSVRSTYSADEIDAVAAYCHELERVYLLPIGLVAGRSGLQLRLCPPRNAQRAAINWATKYELSQGAVAQLARAPAWHAGGHRFESGQLHPPGDTPAPTGTTVGAHRFRNHFGYYMERAAAGEAITVTRRGKPTVKLVAIQQPLERA